MKLRRLFVLALLSLLLLSGCDSLAPTPDSLLAAKERAGITGSLSLYGRIVDDENMPISGVEVEVRAMGFSGTFVSFTDESGYYMFSHEQFIT